MFVQTFIMTNNPPIPLEPSLGELTDSEKIVRSALTDCIAAFDPTWQANSEDPRIVHFLKIYRGEGTSRQFYSCDFLASCLRLRNFSEVSSRIIHPRFVTAAILFQRVAYVPRVPFTKRIREAGRIATESIDFGDRSVRFFKYLRAVQANKFPYEPHVHYRADMDILWDIGLHPFGGDPEEFGRYFNARIREYQHVYGVHRGAIAFRHFFFRRLERMSAHLHEGGHLFRDMWFRERFEQNARTNVMDKLEELRR
jgi:predicted metal-dependent HD superfamily phosphohydrolase